MYFFSKNEPQIAAWMQTIPAGTTGINEVVLQVANPNLPFGGIQTSGMGRTGDKLDLKPSPTCVRWKQTRFNVLPLTFPPFNGRSLSLARLVQRWL